MKRFKILTLLFTVFSIYSCTDTTAHFGSVDETTNAVPVSGQFKKRVLIEDFTGTWCGNCTRVAYGIDKVMEITNLAVPVAVHNGDDPYHFAGIEPLRAFIYPNFSDFPLPTARLNRTITWTSPNTNSAQAKNLTSNNCGLGLALNSSLSGSNINLTVTIKTAQNYSNLKLVVYLLENELIHNQVNYTTYYGNVNPIPNFKHNHVLRSTLTNILGDAITENTAYGQTITKNFLIAVPAEVSNAANIGFAAFVIGSDNTVINVRGSKINETQTFEENP